MFLSGLHHVRTHLLTVSIVDSFLLPKRLYTYRGHFIVEAIPGQTFKIAFERNFGARLNVAAGVDGRYTIEDKPFDGSCDGLIYSGDGPHYIHGYGLRTTRSFEFADSVRDTVAYETTGDLSKVGLIEVVAWAEYVRPQYSDNPLIFGLSRSESTAKSAPSGAVGTKMGKQVEHHEIGQTRYIRAFGDPDTVRIYPRANWWLKAMGLLSSAPKSDPDFPTSFPGQRDDTDYFHNR